MHSTQIWANQQQLAFMRFMLTLVCIAGLFTVSGCGGGGGVGDADRPDTTPASGKVTYKNNPVEGATVVFSPNSQDGKPASGMTDADGMFSLQTFETNDGAIPGEYKVTVTKLKKETSSIPDMDSPDYDPNAETEDSGPEHLLPEKYSKASESGLTATIPAEGEVTDLSFELVD